MNESELEGKTKQSVKTKDSRFMIVNWKERLSLHSLTDLDPSP